MNKLKWFLSVVAILYGLILLTSGNPILGLITAVYGIYFNPKFKIDVADFIKEDASKVFKIFVNGIILSFFILVISPLINEVNEDLQREANEMLDKEAEPYARRANKLLDAGKLDSAFVEISSAPKSNSIKELKKRYEKLSLGKSNSLLDEGQLESAYNIISKLDSSKTRMLRKKYQELVNKRNDEKIALSISKYRKKGFFYDGETKLSKGKICDENLKPINGKVFKIHKNGELHKLIDVRSGEISNEGSYDVFNQNGFKILEKNKTVEKRFYDDGSKKDHIYSDKYFSWYENGTSKHVIEKGKYKKYYPSKTIAVEGSYKDFSVVDSGIVAEKINMWSEYHENGAIKIERKLDENNNFTDPYVEYFHDNGTRAEERKISKATLQFKSYGNLTVYVVEERQCFDKDENSCECIDEIGKEKPVLYIGESEFGIQDKRMIVPRKNSFGCKNSNNIVDENLIEQNFKSDYYQETIVGDETYSKRTFGYLIAPFSPYYYDEI
jgi:hypothetical protein